MEAKAVASIMALASPQLTSASFTLPRPLAALVNLACSLYWWLAIDSFASLQMKPLISIPPNVGLLPLNYWSPRHLSA